MARALSAAQPPPARSSGWIPYVVLLVSLGMTAIAAAYVYTTTYQRNRLRFDRVASEAIDEIQSRMNSYIAALRGLAGLFAASGDPSNPLHPVSREQFRDYVARLDPDGRYPGVQGMGFSLRVPSGAEPQVLQELRSGTGTEDLALWPLDPPRDQRHAIIYLEPLDDRNKKALGYDMFSETDRRDAMIRARDRGGAALSGRVTLVQELVDPTSVQPGFVIYIPVYRGGSIPEPAQREQDLLGFVYSPFRAGDVFNAIFRGKPTITVARLEVFDGSGTSEQSVLHRTAAARPEESSSPPSFRLNKHVRVAERDWTIRVTSLPAFDAESGRDLTPFVLLVGGAVSLILFVLARAQARARSAAEQLADEIQITHRALRYSESRFRRLAESNLIGVVFSDISGKVSDGNEAYFRLIGCTREDALAGRLRWDAITPPRWRYADELALEQLRTTGVAEPFEKEYLRPDGTIVPVMVGVAMLEGSTTETVAFVVDLTERQRTERDLVRAMQIAESANRAKDHFLAVLSHELRTPLTPVLALAASAQNDPAVPEPLRADFSLIRRNVELEARLIDDLLDLTRIGRGKMQLHFETVDAHQCIRAALHVCGDDMAMKRLTVRSNLHAQKCHVRGDAARLQQIVWNLLKNAVKFTPPGGTITISTVNDSPDQLKLSVTDTGMGIDPAMLPRIFDAFEQGELATTRDFGGLGLGLAISKGLVDAHGGTIEAHSDGRGRGATFSVTLRAVAPPTALALPPLQPPVPRVESPARAAPAAATRCSILLVEDHRDTAVALKRLLQNCGYEVREAATVEAAMNLAAEYEFDLLVSDLGLPDGSGLQLIRALRARRPIKAIALTGYGMEEDIARSYEAGFAQHLTKPVNFQTLRAAVQRLILADLPPEAVAREQASALAD